MKVLLASTILATVARGEGTTVVDDKATGGSLEPPEIGGGVAVPPPPLTRGQLIWHGERDIATVVNKAGEWSSDYVVDNMFDDSTTTLWHSNGAMRSEQKVIGFEFKRAMTFHSLTIRKRFDCCGDRYQDVCLVLDGVARRELCTDTMWGFEGDRYSNFITWKNRVEGVRKVELYFRATDSRGHAQIADLKITYTPALVWHGDMNLATISNNAGEYHDGFNWNKYRVSNMFDSNIDTLWHSDNAKRFDTKRIAVNFKQPIKFSEITIVKRQDCCANRYKNVCLVLDGDEIMCTDTEHGFSSSNQYANTITWHSVRSGVRKVELVFYETGSRGHAQIAEMEIIYNNERNNRVLGGQCFIDQVPREMDGYQKNMPGRLTMAKCIAICGIKDYKYAGMQYGNQCFCDNYYPAVETAWSECSMSCDGNTLQSCGGFWRMNVYSTTHPIKLSLPEVKELISITRTDSDLRARREAEEGSIA